jgi:hypothetical protein
LGLGELACDAKFLTLSFEGASPQVPTNQSTKMKTKNTNIPKQTQNMKHRGTMTNETMTHVIKHRN